MKPDIKDHPRDQHGVLIHRWSLYAGSITWKVYPCTYTQHSSWGKTGIAWRQRLVSNNNAMIMTTKEEGLAVPVSLLSVIWCRLMVSADSRAIWTLGRSSWHSVHVWHSMASIWHSNRGHSDTYLTHIDTPHYNTEIGNETVTDRTSKSQACW